MRFRLEAALACLCWMLPALAACSGDDDAAPASSKGRKDAGQADAATHADAAAAAKPDAAATSGDDAGAATVTLAGRLIDYASKDPIEGASSRITVPHSADPTCTRSASGGSYSIEIPTDEDVAVTVRADGCADAIIPEHVKATTALTLSPITNADLKMVTSAAGVTIDATRGHLALNIGAPGATFSVTPASGRLLYFDAAGDPSKTETKTTASGLAGLFNAAAGTYEATYEVGAHTCDVTLGWPSKKANSVRAPVIAGSITSVGMGCF